MSDAAPAPIEFGPFRVHEQLGTGGVAMVHRAEKREPTGARRWVALKRLLPHLRANQELVAEFIREGELARNMRHPNVAQTFETGQIDKIHYLAMELVPGPTLDQIMRHSQAVAGAIPIPVTLALLVQICDALDYAHNLTDAAGHPLGIIHRDISPPNVIVSNTGDVKLVDFGIAKIQNLAATGNFNVTGKNVIKGKMSYVAPEYLQGKLDARADIFALGVIAHELLTGRRLFEGADDFETTARVLEMPIAPPSRWALNLPPDLDHIVLTALARNPDERWQTASAMRTALLSFSKAIADNHKLVQWVTWAFSQKERPTASQLVDVLMMLEAPSDTSLKLPEARDETTIEAPPVVVEDWHAAKTMIGVGDPEILGRASMANITDSARNRPLVRPSQPAVADSARHRPLTESGGNRPLIVEARPLPSRSRRPPGLISGDDRNGIGPGDSIGSRPGGARSPRVLIYAAVIIAAAVGGVLAMSYVLGVL